MKSIKKGKQVKRVSDDEAAQQVKQGWKYCSKSEWRAFRDAKPKKVAKKAAKRQSKKKDKK
jgi:hypothetical protein